MKFLLLINLIFTLIVANRAAVARGVYLDPNHPDKCVVRDVIMSPGEEAKNVFSECGRMICGPKGHVVFHTCGTIGAPPGHKLGKRLEPLAPYPQCCHREFVLIENEEK